jgi:hypothetical protein
MQAQTWDAGIYKAGGRLKYVLEGVLAQKWCNKAAIGG